MAGLCSGAKRSTYAERVRQTPAAQVQSTLADLVAAVQKVDPVPALSVMEGALAALNGSSTLPSSLGLRSQRSTSPPPAVAPDHQSLPEPQPAPPAPPELTPRSRRAWRDFSSLLPHARMRAFMTVRRRALARRLKADTRDPGRPAGTCLPETVEATAERKLRRAFSQLKGVFRSLPAEVQPQMFNKLGMSSLDVQQRSSLRSLSLVQQEGFLAVKSALTELEKERWNVMAALGIRTLGISVRNLEKMNDILTCSETEAGM